MTRITVLYTKDDHIAHLVLNRPEADNAVNQQMAQELEAVCCQINQDSDIYVVMVTGTGNKAFCGGGELEAPESGSYGAAATIASLSQPVIAAIKSRLVGKGKALELILTADVIDAEEALAIGLVNRVMAQEELAAEAEAMAKTMAAKGPIALRYAREAVNKGLDLTLEQGLRLESDLYLLLHTTEDRTEGIRAFLEKKPPQFKGQ